MTDLNVSMLLKLNDQFTKPIKNAHKALKDFTKQARDEKGRFMETPYSRMRDDAKAFAKTARKAGNEFKSLAKKATVFAGVGGYAFKNQFFDLAVDLERYDAQLKTLAGSEEGGKEAMAWIIDFAKDTPADIATAVKSFTQLKAYGLDPMGGAMQTIMDQTARLGYSNEKLGQIGLAIGQIFSKGRIMGQEANQLGEHGINVYGILGERLGKTAAQMRKMGEAGELGRRHITMLMEELKKSGAGAAETQMNTLGGMVSNLGDAWWRFRRNIIKANLGDVMAGQVKKMLTWVTRMEAEGKMKTWAKEAGDAMVSFGRHLKETVEWMTDLGIAIWPTIRRLGGLKAILVGVGAVLAGPLILAVTNMGIALGTLTFSGIGAGFALLGTTAGAALVTVAPLAAAVLGIGAAMASIKMYGDKLDSLEDWIEVGKGINEDFDPSSPMLSQVKMLANILDPRTAYKGFKAKGSEMVDEGIAAMTPATSAERRIKAEIKLETDAPMKIKEATLDGFKLIVGGLGGGMGITTQ